MSKHTKPVEVIDPLPPRFEDVRPMDAVSDDFHYLAGLKDGSPWGRCLLSMKPGMTGMIIWKHV